MTSKRAWVVLFAALLPAFTAAQNTATPGVFNPVVAGRILRGNGTPSSGLCAAVADVGKVYVRANPAAANSTLYVCANTAASTYAWELVSGAGGSGCTVAGAANVLQKNNGSSGCAASLATDDGTALTYTGTGGLKAPGFTGTGAGASLISMPANATPATPVANSWGFTANAAMATSWYETSPNAVPTANQIKLYPAPTSNVSAWSWLTLQLTGDVTSSAGSLATTVGKINGTSLAGLATGILKNTTGTGVPSIASGADILSACTTCVVASSPGVGIAHFAGSTQTVTSSPVSLTADVSGVLPAANIGVVASVFGSGTITIPSGNSILVGCTSTCSVPVPVPTAGYQICVKNDAGVSTGITLSALGSSAMYPKADDSGYGTAGTGTMVSTLAAGNKVCLFGRDATHYELGAINASANWTVN